MYQKCTGARVIDRLAFCKTLTVPMCVGLVINGISYCYGQSGCQRYVPNIVDNEEKDIRKAIANVDGELSEKFASLVSALALRGYIRTTWLSEKVENSPWWMLSARVGSESGTLAHDDDSVIICSAFSEWTSEDAVLAAVVQCQQDGFVASLNTGNKWQTSIKGAMSMRGSFIVWA